MMLVSILSLPPLHAFIFHDYRGKYGSHAQLWVHEREVDLTSSDSGVSVSATLLSESNCHFYPSPSFFPLFPLALFIPPTQLNINYPPKINGHANSRVCAAEVKRIQVITI